MTSGEYQEFLDHLVEDIFVGFVSRNYPEPTDGIWDDDFRSEVKDALIEQLTGLVIERLVANRQG